jgi:hypothetical protein
MQVAQILQDLTDVVDADGYVGMVRAIGFFINLKCPLVVLFCSFQVAYSRRTSPMLLTSLATRGWSEP